MIKNILAEVADEQIIVSVIVVVADAHPLPPAVMDKPGLHGDISEGSIAIIFEEMRGRFLASWKSLKPPAVHQKNVQPTVIVVVVESNPAARGFKQIFVL